MDMTLDHTVCAKHAGPATLRPNRTLVRRGTGLALAAALALASAFAGLVVAPAPAVAQSTSSTATPDPTHILEAREALRRRDAPRLGAARSAALAARHPLAMWADYWDLNLRLPDAQPDELRAFFARWPNTYVEDRLRNDWLLELGKRRDWVNFAADQARFRMNDDREVNCYRLLLEHQAGRPVRDAALAEWLAQRDSDEGCAQMAAALAESGRFTPADLWLKARHAVDASRPRAARQAIALVDPALARSFDLLLADPARHLARQTATGPRAVAELNTLALMRLAASDLEAATAALERRWEQALPPDLAGWAWAYAGRQAAFKLQTDATAHYDRALRHAPRAQARPDGRPGLGVTWSDDTLAWRARALLRQAASRDQVILPWAQVVETIDSMGPAEQRDPAWRYWRARALQVTALENKALPPDLADARIAEARAQLESLAQELHFYGALAAEDLGRRARLPNPPAALSAEERARAVRHAGLERGLQLIAIGLRSEGVREWNYSLRGMGERELLAAAQWACDREVWDRCINTSERTVAEVDLAQRFPLPFRDEVLARTRDIGLDAAYVYGLIRQESRFIQNARSHVGASGLMQVMPATASWTARKIGLPYSPAMLNDRDTNLVLGTSYLKLVLDDLGGSQAMGAAAYNAGPNRLRRWREGPLIEPAIWAENIPFNETRDYVKKVLANALYYNVRLTGEMPSLRARLGRPIGSRDGVAAGARDLP
jgi:soluble lytic murein transglycosylase